MRFFETQFLEEADEFISQLDPKTIKKIFYNIDIAETICYILYYCIENELFDRKTSISDTIKQTFTFLKYFNNNYRSIYHIESMIILIMCKIHNYENT